MRARAGAGARTTIALGVETPTVTGGGTAPLVSEDGGAWAGGAAAARELRLPHNVPNILLGAGLLYFGWLGFNSGSALSAGYVAARAFANTALAGATGMAGMAFSEVLWRRGRNGAWGVPSAVGCATGVVVGLVAITPACGYVSQMAALVIGFVAPIAAFHVERFLQKRVTAVDDTLACFTGHGVGGMVGIISTGLVSSKAEGAPANGAIYGNGALLGVQLTGLVTAIAVCVAGTAIAWGITRSLLRLARIDFLVAPDGAHDLDVSLHGEAAYTRDGSGSMRKAVDDEAVARIVRKELARAEGARLALRAAATSVN
jgi:Amt family ammonium transporter